MAHAETDFCIRHSTRAAGRTCPVTRKHIDGAIHDWRIAMGYAIVSDDGLASCPADLMAILAVVRELQPPSNEVDYGIFDLSAPNNNQCCIYWMADEPIYRGEGARWGVGMLVNGRPRLFSVKAAWEKCPTLATALHRAGHLPGRPVPPAPPPPPPIPPPPPTGAEIRAALAEKAVPLFEQGKVAELLELIREYVS